MITLIHGTSLALSRKYFADAKQHAESPVTFDGATVTLSQLTQALEGQELFAKETQVFIEEFFSKRRTSKETDIITDYLTKQGDSNSIFIWESKELTPKQIAAFGKPTVKKFDVPKEVFAFLDSLLPGNAKQAVLLFHNVLTSEESEFVFFMIVRQFRMMLAVLDESPEQIDELKRLTWQKSKLIKQAQAFGKNALLDRYNNLFDIEQGMKTGQLGMTTQQAIDFFLSTL